MRTNNSFRRIDVPFNLITGCNFLLIKLNPLILFPRDHLFMEESSRKDKTQHKFLYSYYIYIYIYTHNHNDIAKLQNVIFSMLQLYHFYFFHGCFFIYFIAIVIQDIVFSRGILDRLFPCTLSNLEVGFIYF